MEHIQQVDPGSASIRKVFKKLAGSKRILFAILILSPLHTAAPHLFNWYLGKFGSCQGTGCFEDWSLFGTNFSVPIEIWGLLALAFVSMALRPILWGTIEPKAAGMLQDYFDEVIESLKKTRATWFDENPSGKIINRMFGDFATLQRRFVFSISDGQLCYLEIISGFIMVAWINPWAVVPSVFLWYLVLRLQVKVNGAFDHVSTVSSKQKARVIEVLSDVIEGAGVYRSYQAEPHILGRLRQHLEEWLRVEYFQWRLMTWAWTWMWLLAELGIAIVMLSAAWAFHEDHISVAVAGMVLVAVGHQQNMIGWTLDNIGSFLTSKAKAIRFLSLIDLEDEADVEHKLKKSAGELQGNAELPREGLIKISNLTASYRPESPVVLENLNLEIPQGVKLALVGRTGSGKSTIIQALFRMLHVHKGDITIDGKSIYEFKTTESREIFGIVPQNPWLFTGTLRENLDVKNEYADEDLLKCLASLDLDTFNLDDQVQEGGNNYSVGERQLICLARCLLSDQKVIVMDEPTSNIDLETDAKLQRIIRSKLVGRTLIVIAHRKETIADFDIIFSMNQRKVISDRR